MMHLLISLQTERNLSTLLWLGNCQTFICQPALQASLPHLPNFYVYKFEYGTTKSESACFIRIGVQCGVTKSQQGSKTGIQTPIIRHSYSTSIYRQ